LLIPVWNVNGEVVLYQSSPDFPRIRDGKPVKYETLAGGKMVLDVHPSVRGQLADSHIPLYVTEGVKKGDALVSGAAVAIALLEVWNWRGTNESVGKTALPDWENVALNGCVVYICFDTDVMVKREVNAALVRLKALPKHRGSRVYLIDLPQGQDGAKVGVDDFLASGHPLDYLLTPATSELRAPAGKEDDEPGQYRATKSGLIWIKQTRLRDAPIQLTNLCARFVAELVEDDGTEEHGLFEVEAGLDEHPGRFLMTASQFATMNWATQHLGARAIGYPGFGLKDHARAAIQV